MNVQIIVVFFKSIFPGGLKVSLFELAPHPLVDVRLADIVFIPPQHLSQDTRATRVPFPRICCLFHAPKLAYVQDALGGQRKLGRPGDGLLRLLCAGPASLWPEPYCPTVAEPRENGETSALRRQE